MLGLFVEQWNKGFHSEQEVTDLLNFCDKNKITDIFAMVGRRDKGTVIDHVNTFDYMNRLLQSPFKIHAQINLLTLYRAFSKISDGIPDNWTMTHKEVIYLNPLISEAREFIINKVCSIVESYPKLAGINLDGGWYPYGQENYEGSREDKQEMLDTIIKGISDRARRIRPIGISLYTPVSERDNLCDFKGWFGKGWIDTVCPMIFNLKQIDIWKEYNMPTWWMVRYYDPKDFDAKMLQLEGEDIIVFSYPLWKKWQG